MYTNQHAVAQDSSPVDWRSAEQSLSLVQLPSDPPASDYLLVHRATMTQMLAHLLAEQSRFPSRRLRQAIQIIQHVLRYPSCETA